MRRVSWPAVVAFAALVLAAPAAASYGPGPAPLVWQQSAASNGDGVNVVNSASLLDARGSLTSCDDANGDQLCSFGRPTLSPDGTTVLVSRHPVDASGQAGPGQLETVAANGSGAVAPLPPMTASDTQPAYLPGGQRIVFTGRATPDAASQLYEADLDGGGLQRLTRGGGSWAAPCSDGSIVFERGAGLWLIPAHGRHWTRLVRFGSEPDCAPDSRRLVFVTRSRGLGLIGTDGRGETALPHGLGASEMPDRPGGLASPAFSPDGRRLAYIRSYDALQQDGSIDELDVADLRGRIHSRRVVAGVAGGSIGSDAEQSETSFAGW